MNDARSVNFLDNIGATNYIEDIYSHSHREKIDCAIPDLDNDNFFHLIARVRESSPSPDIQVSCNEGRMLSFFRKLIDARYILEFGTHVGYSALWLANDIQINDGHIWSLERNSEWARIARQNIAMANMERIIDVIHIDALDFIRAFDNDTSINQENSDNNTNFAIERLLDINISTSIPRRFDMIVIDADKASYMEYFHFSKSFLRQGGLLIIDNCLLRGDVCKEYKHSINDHKNKRILNKGAENKMSARARCIDKLNRMIASDPDIERVLLPMYDGWTLCMKK